MLEVTAGFDLSEQIVHRLPCHSGLLGECDWALPVRAGPTKDLEVCGVDIGETAGMKRLEHVSADEIDGGAQESADRERADC